MVEFEQLTVEFGQVIVEFGQVKGIGGGVHHFFYMLVSFYRV